MGIADMRTMKVVINTMKKETERLERKFNTFIDNENDIARMIATNYELLKVIANKVGLEDNDFPKPLIIMEIEKETKEVE